jgi:lysophospholipase L1-like esterase
MKRILCYGDSNTWGYNPVTQDRFDRQERWTGQLSQALGNNDYDVIEEGLNGRTTVWDDPIEGYRNGREYLIPCLETHMPLDLVIIFLGLNDLKKRFSLSTYDIAEGAGVLVQIVQKSNTSVMKDAPQVLLVSPPLVGKLAAFAEMFEGAEAKSQKFAQHYQRVANKLGCAFLDSSTLIVSSSLDGIHFEQSEHAILGRAIAIKVMEIVG